MTLKIKCIILYKTQRDRVRATKKSCLNFFFQNPILGCQGMSNGAKELNLSQNFKNKVNLIYLIGDFCHEPGVILTIGAVHKLCCLKIEDFWPPLCRLLY